MKPVFVDTAALIALGNRRDAYHVQATKVNEELRHSGRNYVTTSAIILEFGNAFSQLDLRATAIRIIDAIRQSQKWNYIDVDRRIMNSGLALYRNMEDKEWGLVDCTSIVIARDMGITEIFSTDRHFQQAGLTLLLG